MASGLSLSQTEMNKYLQEDLKNAGGFQVD
jgi:hypothetical protein